MRTINNFGSLLNIFCLAGLIGCTIFIANKIPAQDKNIKLADNKNEPKISIKVNKQTDKNGNITRYDSTYEWSWTGNGKVPSNVDSMLNKIQDQFSFNQFGDNDMFKMPFDNNDSSFVSDNYGEMFEKEFGNFDNINQLIKSQRKMMENFFNNAPILTVPENQGSPKKDSTYLHTNSYKTML